MLYLFVFYILAPAISVHCQEFQHEEKGPHVPSSIASCRAERQQIILNRVNASLMPRPRHVVLIPQPGFEYNPRTVTVNRCNGFCPDRWSPMPTKTGKKNFVVHLRREGTMDDNCVSVEVDEHLACKCMCMQDSTICTTLQDWDGTRCGCSCKNRQMQKNRCERTGGLWNDMRCACEM